MPLTIAAHPAGARGVLVGGLGAGAGQTLKGVAIGLAGVRAGRSLEGVALSVLSTSAPEQKGVMLEGANGVDFRKRRFWLGNARMTGLCIGLVNATAQLKGVQFGLVNYAGNNRRGLRLLPLMNLHL